MDREKSLLKNTLIITIGRICTQMITFFLLPLYTTLLSTEEYGIVDLLNTFVSLLLPIITLQVEQAVYRELIEERKNENKKREIISNSFFTVTIQIIIYLIIFMLILPIINNKYKYFLATNVVAHIFSSLFMQIARGLGENKKYAIASFLSALFTTVFNIIFIAKLNLGAQGMLLGIVLGQILCATYSFITLKLYKYIEFKQCNKNVIKRMWRYSAPLIPNAISWWVFNASDRVIVSAILGVSFNGLLSAATKFSTVYITMYNIFNISWTESISLHINDVDIKDYFKKMFNIVLSLFTAIAVGMIAVMPFVYPLMINQKFNGGYCIVPILIIASLFNVMVGLISVIYVAKRNTRAIANTSLISAIINIVVHLILIKYIGLYAAAVSTFIAFFAMSVYRLYDIKKQYFKIQVERKLVFSGLISLIIVCITYYINNLYLNIISFIYAVVFAIILNRKSIQNITSLLKNKIEKISK